MNKGVELKDKTVGFFEENYKTILIGAGVIVGGYLIWKAVKGITDASGGVFDELSFNGSSNSGQLIDGSDKKTITKNQAANIAAILLTAMNQMGTDEDAIFNALEGKTAGDYAMIFQEFGQVRYDGASASHWPFPERNLTEWLASELNDSEMKQLNHLMPGVLNT